MRASSAPALMSKLQPLGPFASLKLKREVEELRRQFVKEYNLDDIVAQSNAMKLALRLSDTIARSYDTTVLIEGETGTGKEVIARFIHHRSDRFNKPFVNINCGAISKELVESELFGYEKGSFTGGLQEGKRGKFEAADGGSILLDEISELLPATQVKLLTFLEEKAFYDILKDLALKYDFEYPEDRLIILAQAVKEVVDDKAKYTDWSRRNDIKAELKADLIILLAEHDYPPVDRDEVYKEIFEQAENFKRYA